MCSDGFGKKKFEWDCVTFLASLSRLTFSSLKYHEIPFCLSTSQVIRVWIWDQANIAATDYHNQCEIEKVDGMRFWINTLNAILVTEKSTVGRPGIRSCILLAVSSVKDRL